MFVTRTLQAEAVPDLLPVCQHIGFNGEKPAELIQQGRTEEVLAVSNQLLDGVFI